MIRFKACWRLSIAAAVSAIVLSTSACGDADVMRAYNQDGTATSEFVAVVADFMAAVHKSDVDHLRRIMDPAESEAGLKQLIAEYGGATLSATTYDFDFPGEGGAEIDVTCADGTRASFSQGFFGRDGHWRAVIHGNGAITVDPPQPGVALSLPVRAPSTSAVSYWNQYPPCSDKPVISSTG